MNKLLKVTHLHKKYHTLNNEITALEDINFSALKAEYDRNATPSMFSMMLSCATANFDYDKKYKGNFPKLSPKMDFELKSYLKLLLVFVQV